mgnify:CR=1 FL=1
MFDPGKDWLPMGSVVRMSEAQRLVMVAGYMPIDGASGRAWDYAGYPYPEGKQDPSEVFFDRADIAEIFQMGFCDAEGMAFIARLEVSEAEYQRERKRREELQAPDAEGSL